MFRLSVLLIAVLRRTSRSADSASRPIGKVAAQPRAPCTRRQARKEVPQRALPGHRAHVYARDAQGNTGLVRKMAEVKPERRAALTLVDSTCRRAREQPHCRKTSL